ncbi:hypothetical protein J4464_04120 [Candidatus Woesearchaeota archaeon]|nr:hypothetical protein [Candidatus Woesearchaeota archaeon]
MKLIIDTAAGTEDIRKAIRMLQAIVDDHPAQKEITPEATQAFSSIFGAETHPETPLKKPEETPRVQVIKY